VLYPVPPSSDLDGKGLLPVSEKPYTVLFLCTGNSARSILAEVMLTHLGGGRFTAYSAGSHPKGTVHPLALATLQSMGFPIDGLRSKSWQEFAQPGAPPLDGIVTVCDAAAGEVCPIWPGKPMIAHWGVEDPAAFQGTEDEQRAKFRKVALLLRRRIAVLLRLPLATLDAMTLQTQLQAIGQE
jgi:arsenate reductase (thioredoxin)